MGTSLKAMSEDGKKVHSGVIDDVSPTSARRVPGRDWGPKSIAPSLSDSDQISAIHDVGITHVQARQRQLGASAGNPPMPQSANLQPRLAGIGIAFESVAGGALIIDSFSPGGAAEELGAQGILRPGDELLAVDGRPVAGKQGRALAAMLIGDEGSAVRVSFRRWTDVAADSRRAYELTVDLIRRAPAVSGRRRSVAREHPGAPHNLPRADPP